VTSVAIIGLGYIGQAQFRMFSKAGFDAFGWDVLSEEPYPYERIAFCDFAVICVGTPQEPDGHADLTYLNDALAMLPPGVPVLIRSTVPPGTTEIVQGSSGPAVNFKPRMIAHAPEFMHEREGGAWAESTDVPFLILGGSDEAQDFFLPHLSRLFPRIHQCDVLTAELVKYVVNLYLATRVTFVNEMAQITEQFAGNWTEVQVAWLMDPRITLEYTGMAGFEPGFGGRCWPKDLAALIAASEDAGYDPEFLKAVRTANERFRS